MTNFQKKFVMNFLIYGSAFSFVALFVMIIGESYVRWSLNQNFSFLGGTGVLGLAILVATQMFSLAHFVRSEK